MRDCIQRDTSSVSQGLLLDATRKSPRGRQKAARASYRVDCQYSGRKRAGRIAHQGARQAKYTIERSGKCEVRKVLSWSESKMTQDLTLGRVHDAAGTLVEAYRRAPHEICSFLEPDASSLRRSMLHGTDGALPGHGLLKRRDMPLT